ncbi:MAG TPA: cytidine deaminase [Chitinophagaceae bacterium]|nr:cytidine deaminase [Chitinophagaceae bacterium]
MSEKKTGFAYQLYENSAALDAKDASLLEEARKITRIAYAPYSHFHVGAAAQMEDGSVVKGTNQENASYPVGTCAERVLLGVAATLHPEMAIKTMAISYASEQMKSDHPISPCGMCRQALLEFETRVKKPIRLILSGQEGKVIVISTASHLLPFAFTKDELG